MSMILELTDRQVELVSFLIEQAIIEEHEAVFPDKKDLEEYLKIDELLSTGGSDV